MKLLWTKSALPLSVVIRGVTGEPCSHFLFVFECPPTGVVFQSNLLGTGIEFITKLEKTVGFKVVHEYDLPMTDEQEDRAWDIIVKKYALTGYNFKGATYLGWRKLLYRLLREPIPAVNKWNQQGTMFCDQTFDILNQLDDPRLPKVDVSSGMSTPEDLWLLIDNFQQGLKG